MDRDAVTQVSVEPPDVAAGEGTIARREFLRRAAATAAAASGVGGGAVLAFAPAVLPAQQQQPQEPPPLPLGNGEPPALQFQAYPGGTGALLEKLWRESGGSPFERHPIQIERWRGPVPASEEEVAFLPVHRLAALIRDRRISPTELTEIYLARLERFDPVLLCAVTIMKDRAREEAQQAEAEIKAGRWRGPLHGIPWGVKDLFSTRGARTTWGARDFEQQVIDEDAEVVVRLREAGAVLIAKLASGQFASGDNWYRGQTKNPWNPAQGSSGSSAGPASATAAGCVAFAIGTETQGSIVSPARRCGVSALRPTFGRVSRYGGMVLSWSMDKVGPLCRTIEDCALVFHAIHGASEQDPSTLTAPFRFDRRPDLRRLRIGYTANAPEAFVTKLRELGANPQPMPALPNGNSRSLGVESAAAFDFYVAQQDARAAAAGAQPSADSARAAPDTRAAGDTASTTGTGRGGTGGGRFRNGRTVTALDYVQSQRRRLLLMHQMAAIMKDFDMYVSGSGEIGMTNQTGHPTVVVPYAMSDGERPQPVCTMLVGQLFADDKILSVAHAYQVATDWHKRHPNLG